MWFAGILDLLSVLWEGISSVAVFNRWLCGSALCFGHCWSIILGPHVCFKLVKPSPAYQFLLDRVALKGDTFLQFYMVIALRLVDATLDVLDKRSSSCPVQYTTFNRWCIVSLSLLLQIGEFWWGTMLSIVNGSLFLVKLRVSEKQLQWSSEVMMTKWKNRAFLRSFFGQRYL